MSEQELTQRYLAFCAPFEPSPLVRHFIHNYGSSNAANRPVSVPVGSGLSGHGPITQLERV